MIKIGETSALGRRGVDFALELGQLRLQQFIGDGLATCRHGVLAGQEHVGAQ